MFLHIETQKKELSDSLVKIGQDHIFTKFQNKPAEGKREKHWLHKERERNTTEKKVKTERSIERRRHRLRWLHTLIERVWM